MLLPMRLSPWLRWCAVLFLLMRLASSACSAQELTPKRLSEHVWIFEGASALGTRENRNFISNAGLIIGPEGAVLVDALGSPAAARAALAAIRRLTDKPLTHVILTHYHADHVYGLQVFKAAGARIVAHQLGREYLYSATAAQRLQASIEEGLVEAGTQLVAADQWIDGETKLHVAGLDLLLLPVGPAHTREDLAVWLASDKLIFAGDLVFSRRVPYVGEADSAHWIASLDQLLAWPARIIVPGHGPASTEAQADLLQTRDYLAYLRATMGRAAREMTDFDAAYAATDWSRFEALPLFKAANRKNAYNTYLLMESQEK